jgi:hypothetical protein
MSPARRSGGSLRRKLERRQREALLDQLRQDARRIAAQFNLQYAAIDAESGRVKRRYGSCFSDGRIKIRLTHAVSGRPLRYSSLVDTLCHELAHLRYFSHGPRFRALYRRILEWARGAGIYRPRPVAAQAGLAAGAPLQLALFPPSRAATMLRRTASEPDRRAG